MSVAKGASKVVKGAKVKPKVKGGARTIKNAAGEVIDDLGKGLGKNADEIIESGVKSGAKSEGKAVSKGSKYLKKLRTGFKNTAKSTWKVTKKVAKHGLLLPMAYALGLAGDDLGRSDQGQLGQGAEGGGDNGPRNLSEAGSLAGIPSDSSLKSGVSDAKRELNTEKSIQQANSQAQQNGLVIAGNAVSRNRSTVSDVNKLLQSYSNDMPGRTPYQRVEVEMPDDALRHTDPPVHNLDETTFRRRLITNTDKISKLLFTQSEQLAAGFKSMQNMVDAQIKATDMVGMTSAKGSLAIAKSVQAGNELELNEQEAAIKQSKLDLEAQKRENALRNMEAAKATNANADLSDAMRNRKNIFRFLKGAGDKAGGYYKQLQDSDTDNTGLLIAGGITALLGAVGGIASLFEHYGDYVGGLAEGVVSNIGDAFQDAGAWLFGGKTSSGETKEWAGSRLWNRWKSGEETMAEDLAIGAVQGIAQGKIYQRSRTAAHAGEEALKGTEKVTQRAGSEAATTVTEQAARHADDLVKPAVEISESGEKFIVNNSDEVAKQLVNHADDAVKTGTTIAKNAGEAGIKETQKVAEKFTKEASEKGIEYAMKNSGKTFGKTLGKYGAKYLPMGLSAGIGTAFAAQRWNEGDYLGAILEEASGVAACFPGVGTAISLLLDGILICKDIANSGLINLDAEIFHNSPIGKAIVAIEDRASEVADPLKRLYENGSALKYDALDRINKAIEEQQTGQYDWNKEINGGSIQDLKDSYEHYLEYIQKGPAYAKKWLTDPNDPYAEARKFASDWDARFHTGDLKEIALDVMGMSGTDRMTGSGRNMTGLGGPRHRYNQAYHDNAKSKMDEFGYHQYSKYWDSIHAGDDKYWGSVLPEIDVTGDKLHGYAYGGGAGDAEFSSNTFDNLIRVSDINWWDKLFGSDSEDSSSSSTYTKITSSQMKENAKLLYPLLKNKLKLSNEQVVGLLGVLAAESSLNPAAENLAEKKKYPKSYGEGLAQWSNARKNKFMEWWMSQHPNSKFDSISKTSLNDQADYLTYEFENYYGPILDMLRGADTIEESVDIVRRGYENGNGRNLVDKDTIRYLYSKNYPDKDAYEEGHERRAGLARGLWDELGIYPTIANGGFNPDFSLYSNIDTDFNPFSAALTMQKGVLIDRVNNSEKDPKKSIDRCGLYVAKGLKSGGLDFTEQPDAKGYLTELPKRGFEDITDFNTYPQIGDISIIEPTTKHPTGHIAMWDGSNWVSDFVQSGEKVFSNDINKIHRFRHKSATSAIQLARNWDQSKFEVNQAITEWTERQRENPYIFDNIPDQRIRALDPELISQLKTQPIVTGSGDADNEGAQVSEPTIVNHNSPSFRQGDTIINNNQQYVTNIHSDSAALSEVM